tara:strand:- start:1105 stop:1308 length:204 start_codon:yes stop_codon:yes gene_type:complete
MSTSFTHCKKNHPLIWYWDDTECPVCQAQAVIDDMKETVEDMESSLYDAAIELERLRSRVSNLEDEI